MSGRNAFDFTPLFAPPSRTEDLEEVWPAVYADLAHIAGTGHRHNGTPEVRPYAWRRGDAEREAEVQARIAAAKSAAAKARRRRRGKRPAPVVTGLRVDPRRQP